MREANRSNLLQEGARVRVSANAATPPSCPSGASKESAPASCEVGADVLGSAPRSARGTVLPRAASIPRRAGYRAPRTHRRRDRRHAAVRSSVSARRYAGRGVGERTWWRSATGRGRRFAGGKLAIPYARLVTHPISRRSPARSWRFSCAVEDSMGGPLNLRGVGKGKARGEQPFRKCLVDNPVADVTLRP